MIAIDQMKQTIDLMLHPASATQKKMSIGQALGFYYQLAIIPLVISLILGAVVGAAAAALFSHFLGSMAAIGTGAALLFVEAYVLLVFLILIPVGIFISAAILHLFGKFLFRQFKATYTETFTSLVYGEAPAVLFFWLALIPIIDFIYIVIYIWGFVVSIFALSNQQRTSKLSVIGVLVGTVVVVFILAFVIGVILGAALFI